MENLPILDTEEKLRAYLNNIAGCEVDPLTIRAHIFPDRVHLDINSDPGIHIAFAQSSPSWMHVISYGIVDRAVLPVLKELHARHDREIQEAAQKRWEESCEREAEKADRRTQCLEQEIAYHQRELEKEAPLPTHPNLQPLQMNLPYIQSELFRQLVGMETLLNSECVTRITKDIDTSMNFEIYDFSKVKTSGKWVRVMFRRVETRNITTPAQITNAITRIWQGIPADCKKDPLI